LSFSFFEVVLVWKNDWEENVNHIFMFKQKEFSICFQSKTDNPENGRCNFGVPVKEWFKSELI